MKDTVMVIETLGGKIEAKTNGMVVLKSFENAGNEIRIMKGKSIFNVAQYLKSESVCDFIKELADIDGKDPKEYIKVVGKGRSAKTYVHVDVAIKIAMKMHPRFEAQIIRTFRQNKILERRLASGDKFKALNMAIDNCLPNRKDKNNKGIYIQVAKILREKCGLGERSWNEATAEELKQRYEIENKIADWLDMGLVKDYDHLKQLIEKM